MYLCYSNHYQRGDIMKFYEGPEELNNVIGRYYVTGDSMVIFYLNHGSEVILDYTEEQKQKVQETMLKQLQERNASIELRPYVLQKNFDTAVLTTLAGSYIANRIVFGNIETYLTIGTIFGTVYLTNRIFKKRAIINDVRKANLFLDMHEELQTPEGAKAVEKLNFDKIYSKELNVNTLDYFSYGEIKEVHKKLKKVK